MNGEIAIVILLNPVLDLLKDRYQNCKHPGGMEYPPGKRGVWRPSPENLEITFDAISDHSVIYIHSLITFL